jgi:hypothetical protein
MGNAVKWTLGAMGLLLAGVTPYLWFYKPALLLVACPLVLIWAIWLMIEYLQWAKTLGKK